MHPTSNNIGAYVAPVLAVAPASSVAATVNGVAIDRINFESLVLHLTCGVATGSPTGQSVIVKLQHSDASGSGYEDFTDRNGNGASVALTANGSYTSVDIDLAGAKRYVRAVVTVAFTGGSGPAIPIAVSVILGGPQKLPV
jgi:hypothetical protein